VRRSDVSLPKLAVPHRVAQYQGKLALRERAIPHASGPAASELTGTSVLSRRLFDRHPIPAWPRSLPRGCKPFGPNPSLSPFPVGWPLTSCLNFGVQSRSPPRGADGGRKRAARSGQGPARGESAAKRRDG